MKEADYIRVSTLTAVRCAEDVLRWANPSTKADNAAHDEIMRLLFEWHIRLEERLNA